MTKIVIEDDESSVELQSSLAPELVSNYLVNANVGQTVQGEIHKVSSGLERNE